MAKNVTQEEIIKFVYGELSFQDTVSLYDTIDEHPDKKMDLEYYASIKFELNKFIESPSNRLEDRVLDYSKDFN